MRMPLLPIPFRPATNLSSRPRARGLLLGLVAGATSLSLGTLRAQTSDAELNQLKSQMQQMQQDYEKRLATMESQVKTMQSQVALTASIAKSRTITGPDGKAVSMEGPVLLPPLDTFTRNFKFHLYLRAGVGFTANGVGQTFSFKTPDIGHGRFRLGNESDFYFETGPIWDHMLGDPALGEDVVDVKAKMTIGMASDKTKGTSENLSSDNFTVFLREAYVEMKNVIKSAPEVTFWAGQRFYDRYNIDSQDYFYLDSSGWGAGAYNIPLGPGSLAIAYIGGINSGTGDFWRDDVSFNDFTLDVHGGTGDFYRHTFDIRWGDIDFLWGKLKLVGIGSYQHGGDFSIAYGSEVGASNGLTLAGQTGQGHVNNSWGGGGGFVQQWDLPPSWGKLSFVQFAALYGYGLVDFDAPDVNLGKLNNSYLSAVAGQNGVVGDFEDVNPYNNSQRARANVYWVWNPTDNFSMGTWVTYQFDDQGFTANQVNSDGSISSASPNSHLVTAGIRPVYWLWGPFAIQGSFGYSYLSNNRVSGAAFGDGGSLGVFTICPTIKPRGGFFTRPELRAFATFAVWSDSLKGAIGTPAYADKNYGFIFGVQAETWF
jgi:maltoporin